jgi:hypothetical protein
VAADAPTPFACPIDTSATAMIEELTGFSAEPNEVAATNLRSKPMSSGRGPLRWRVGSGRTPASVWRAAFPSIAFLHPPCSPGGGPGGSRFHDAAIAGAQEDCRVPSSDRATLATAPDATLEACRGRTI